MSKVESALKIISFEEIDYWDVKRYKILDIFSQYPLIKLSKLILERRDKVQPFDEPDSKFGILGVNNKIGLFDAYEEYGKNINQAYKKVNDGDLSYNPYRINVGSIGLKTKNHKFSLISPAYVVFGCREELQPEFLFKVFKTNTFNQIINYSTTGSVRQNLKFETMARIKIPLPPFSKQIALLKQYNKKINLAEKLKFQALEIEKGIEVYLSQVLGIKNLHKEQNKKGLQSVEFKTIDRWDFDYNSKLSYISALLKEGKYELKKFGSLIKNYQYGLSEKASTENIGIPMLRMNNIVDAELDLAKLKYIKKTERIKDFILDKNDLLFNRTNSKELVGKTAIFREKEEYTFASYLIRVKVNMEEVNIDYINYLFNSEIIQFQKDLVSRQTLGQANINAQELQMFLFPVPALEIQNKIANEITKRKEQIKKLKNEALKNRELGMKEFEREIFIL